MQTFTATCKMPLCKNTFETAMMQNGKQKQYFCCPKHKDAYRWRHQEEPLGLPPPDQPDPLTTDELVSEVQQRGFYVTKVPQTSDEHFVVDLKHFEGNHVKFAAVSDTHLTSKYQQLTFLKQFYRLCADREIADVLHAGDLGDGNGNVYKGHEYDLFLHGQDESEAYIIEHYPKEEGITTRVISGNHDDSFYKQTGHDFIKSVSEKRADIQYLGVFGATLSLKGAKHIDMYLHHPRGSMPYARSYRIQKVAEQLAPPKPRFMFSGHLHTPCILSGYRNIECIGLGCFQSQTPLLKAMGVYPFIAGLFVDLTYDKDGIVAVEYEMFPFYVPIEDDY